MVWIVLPMLVGKTVRQHEKFPVDRVRAERNSPHLVAEETALERPLLLLDEPVETLELERQQFLRQASWLNRLLDGPDRQFTELVPARLELGVVRLQVE